MIRIFSIKFTKHSNKNYSVYISIIVFFLVSIIVYRRIAFYTSLSRFFSRWNQIEDIIPLLKGGDVTLN